VATESHTETNPMVYSSGLWATHMMIEKAYGENILGDGDAFRYVQVTE